MTTNALPGRIRGVSAWTPKTTPSTLAPRIRRYVVLSEPSPAARTPALRQTSSAGLDRVPRGSAGDVEAVARGRAPRTSAPSASSSATSARPIPPAAPVTSAVSGNKDDLAHGSARRDQLVRRLRLLERELGADDRPDRPVLPEREQVTHALLDELGLDAGSAARGRSRARRCCGRRGGPGRPAPRPRPQSRSRSQRPAAAGLQSDAAKTGAADGVEARRRRRSSSAISS